MAESERMTPVERRAAFSLAALFLIRMLGLFMILPVFTLYAENLPDSTPTLIGLAVGIYGLTQAVLQMPFGLASDHFGRKKVLYVGLAIFACGSAVAALSDTMVGIIIGRALQGAGAIAATVMALAADLTREEHRTKAMAVIGASIGLSFSLSLVFGPLLNPWIGVPGLFWLTGIFALVGMVVVRFVVPDPVESRFHRDTEPVPAQFKTVLADGQLARLDFGIFALHLILTANFIVLPLALRDSAGLPADQHWWVYLTVMLVALAAMVPFVIKAEKQRRMKQIFVGAICVIGLAELAMAVFSSSLWMLIGVLLVFFVAFNVLEATLPSLIAKTAPPDKKGTAMGIYSSSQFFGAFCGGFLGGTIYHYANLSTVFLFCSVVALVWLVVAYSMRDPRYLSSYMLRIEDGLTEDDGQKLAAQIAMVRGVAEAVVVPRDGVAYLKVDNHVLDRDGLSRFSAAGA